MAKIEDLKDARTKGVTIVDIRKKPDEQQIPGSVRYNGEELEAAQQLPFDKDKRVVLYCGSGNSCSRVAQTLRDKGYAAEALEGGYGAWKAAGLPLEPIGEVRDIAAE